MSIFGHPLQPRSASLCRHSRDVIPLHGPIEQEDGVGVGASRMQLPVADSFPHADRFDKLPPDGGIVVNPRPIVAAINPDRRQHRTHSRTHRVPYHGTATTANCRLRHPQLNPHPNRTAVRIQSTALKPQPAAESDRHDTTTVRPNSGSIWRRTESHARNQAEASRSGQIWTPRTGQT